MSVMYNNFDTFMYVRTQGVGQDLSGRFTASYKIYRAYFQYFVMV
jgi:hypothetical protein